ncbi:MAG: HAMP domain-containing histidine kinase [Candidatus Symbiothrix sp.]|nr:HAMP domain-containing histidine kinase [Candidatus Symbiothrix sp.]
MEKRIKVIYILSIITSVAMITSQMYWLFNQYQLSLHNIRNEAYTKTLHLAEADMALRDSLQNRHLSTMTRSEMSVDRKALDTKVVWMFEAYIIDNQEESAESPLLQYDSLYIESLRIAGKDVRKHVFRVEVPNQKYDAFDALNRFHINEKCPFTIERLDSLLRTNGLNPDLISIETTDSMIWDAGRTGHTLFLHPSMDVTYPFNILQQQQFRVTYRFSVFDILRTMLFSFICSLMLSFLLIFCFLYQIATIFRQQRIDETRKSFIFTMLHELKRPITALKLCVSFMRNDKMMQDSEMKEEIINNSHNELDNLSSYFSKLRDVMADDTDTIPLNLSTFNLKTLVEQCIKNQFIPADRKVEIKVSFENEDYTITADKMHIYNVLCNLLENSVKYSEGQAAISVDCRLVGEKYVMEVSDTGSGISKTESNYVFDRFFRSKDVIEKNIPGMGLGLFYVKLLIEAHHGDITLHSELGKGSRFTVVIPRKQ